MNTSALSVSHLSRPSVLWASGLGLGFLPKAPGTWGSIGAVLIWWFFLAELSWLIQLAICSGYFLSGWWASHQVCNDFAIADAPQIVADEVVGMWLACLLLPKVWWLIFLAFVLFRVLDIVKPGPIGWLDKNIKSSLGVMLDDVVAGVSGGCVLYFSFLLLQRSGYVPLT